jgi:hypothetical protein
MEAFYTAAPEDEEEEEDLDDFLNDAPKENKVRMRTLPLMCPHAYSCAAIYVSVCLLVYMRWHTTICVSCYMHTTIHACPLLYIVLVLDVQDDRIADVCSRLLTCADVWCVQDDREKRIAKELEQRKKTMTAQATH